MSKFYVNWAKVKILRLQNWLFMLAWKLWVKFYPSIKIFHQYIFQFISLSLWTATFSCHDLANDVYSQTAKTVFRYLKQNFSKRMAKKQKNTNWVIECFHSRGQHLCKFIGTKQSVCIRKEFNSHGIG